MSAINTQCPPEEMLSDFGLGKLDAAQSETIGQHLETCADCRQRVAGLSGDSFVNRLRGVPERIDRTFVAGDSASNAAHSSETPSPEDGLPRPSRTADDKQRDGLGSPSSAPPELANHPDYEIIKELGQGGMGTVYLAKNHMMDRLEVLKVVSKSLLDKPGALERFQQEIRSAAKLLHPNIVAAHAVLRPGDLLVFAMEYVPGQDLMQVVKKRGYLPIANATFYAHQVALGLQHAHEKGMVHRDIKPNNLMLAIEGKKHVIKILDFGLAKATSEKAAETALTKSGQMLGTPDYIAPEQTLDAHQADIRADIYSLGCTLYYFLAGRPPFQEASLYALLDAHQRRDPTPLNLVRPDVPVELAAVIGKMLAKDPAKRYQTPVEVAKALTPFFKPSQATAAVTSSPLAEQPSGAVETIQAAASATEDFVAAQPAAAMPMPVPARATPTSLHPIPVAQAAPGAAISIDTHRETARHGGGWRARPRWQQYAMTGGTAAVLLLGIVLLVQTPHGTIEIALSDPNAKVSLNVDKNQIDIGDLDQPLSLEVGEHELKVTGNGYETFTKKFTVTKGKNAPLTVTLLPKDEPLAPAARPTPVDVADAPASPAAQSTGATELGSTPLEHNKPASCCRFSPDGMLLATGGQDGIVKIWDAVNGTKLHEIDIHETVQDVTFSPDSKIFLTWTGGSPRGNSAKWKPKFWDSTTAKEVTTFPITRPIVGPLAFSTDGTLIAAGGKDATVDLFDASGKTIGSLAGQRGAISCLAISPDSKLLACGSDALVLKLWNLADKSELLTQEPTDNKKGGFAPHVHAVLFSNDSSYLVAGMGASTLVYDVSASKVLWKKRTNTWRAYSLAISPDNKFVVATGGRGEGDHFVVVDALTGKTIRSVPAWHGYQEGYRGAEAIALSPDGGTLASAGPDNTVKVWDTATWEEKGEAASRGKVGGDAVTANSSQPSSPSKAKESAEPPAPNNEGWKSLFNGRDLTGWSAVPGTSTSWKVEDGILIGSGEPSLLFSQRGDYSDFAFRVEAKINAGGNSGQFFRAEFGSNGSFYEAQIAADDPEATTGSLYMKSASAARAEKIAVGPHHRPGEWFTQEVTALGNHIVIKLNGETVVDHVDHKYRLAKGHLALQLHRVPGTVVQFRRIEVKELTAGATSAIPKQPPPAAQDHERAVAEWVLSKGGKVTLEGSGSPIASLDEMPTGSVNLRNLDLENTAIVDAELARIQRLPSLVGIGLQRTAIGDEGLAKLTNLPKLRDLNLGATKVTGAGIATLRQHQSFESLYLSGPNVDDNFLEAVSKLPRLSFLDMGDVGVTSAGMRHLQNLKRLRVLNVNSRAVKDETLKYLRDLPIDTLRLWDTSVTGKGLIHIASLSRLQELSLYQLPLEDSDLAELARLPLLRTLNLSSTNVTDAGCEHLKNCKTLRELGLPDTLITQHGLDVLRTALPDCKVDSSLPASNKSSQSPSPPAAAKDHQREVAEWVLSKGGKVEVESGDAWISRRDKLPIGSVRIKRIDLQKASLADPDLERIRQLPNLQSLKLVSTAITDEGLARLAESAGNRGADDSALPMLDYLDIGGTRITDAGMQYVTRFKRLREIGLANTAVGDSGIEQLVSGLPDLWGLYLHATRMTNAGLKALAPLRLERLGLGGLVDNGGVQFVRDFKKLKHLNVNCRLVDDDGLRQLRSDSLEEIMFVGDTAVTGKGLRFLGECPRLQSIGWWTGPPVSDDDLAALPELPELRDLGIHNSAAHNLTDASLEHIKRHSRLTSFSTGECKITQAGINALRAALPNCRIETKNLQGVPTLSEPARKTADHQREVAEWVLSKRGKVKVDGVDGEIADVAKLPTGTFSLTEVDLARVLLKKQDAARLHDLPRVVMLNLQDTLVDDQWLSSLAPLPQLRKLDLRETSLTAAGVEHLKDFPRLEEIYVSAADDVIARLSMLSALKKLDLYGASVTNAALSQVSNFKSLTFLSACGRRIDDDGLANLSSDSLEYLVLWGSSVQGTGLKKLRRLPKLHTIWLHDLPVHDDDLRGLEGLPSLGSLGIGRTQITDKGLDILSRLNLPSLQRLEIEGTQVTDAGLEQLKRLTNLKGLRANSTKLTQPGVDSFRKALPNCQIEWP